MRYDAAVEAETYSPGEHPSLLPRSLSNTVTSTAGSVSRTASHRAAEAVSLAQTAGSASISAVLSPIGSGPSLKCSAVVEEMKMKIRQADLADLDSDRIWDFK